MNSSPFLLFASETAPHTAASGSILDTLGIDPKQLLFQIVAFLILLFILQKFVFPTLIKAVDKRRELNEAGVKAALEAEKRAEKTQADVEKLMQKARQEANDIVTTAKAEATDMAQKAEAKSKAQAERIVADAEESIGKEVLAARKSLHNEMIDLVTIATEKVTTKAVSADVDRKIIVDAVKGDA